MIKYKKEDIEKVKEDLLNGKIIAFPTDTVFGLGCIYDNEEAIERIYEAKNRSISKKLPMMVSDTIMLKDYAKLPLEAKKLFDKFTPGPLTIILEYKDNNDTVAIRIPNDEWIIELIRKLNKPLLVTSANLSGAGSLIKYEDVIKELDNRIDAIVVDDAKGESASTIVNMAGEVTIIREGPISKEEIFDTLK